MKYVLHTQGCFRDSVPKAIEHGCHEMDTMCLETQFRTLGRQNITASAGSAASAGDRQSPRAMLFGRTATGAAVAASPVTSSPSSPRAFIYGGGSLENESQARRGRAASNGSSDVRSRLSGAAAGMLGGATAAVAVATRVGEVGGWWVYVINTEWGIILVCRVTWSFQWLMFELHYRVTMMLCV